MSQATPHAVFIVYQPPHRTLSQRISEPPPGFDASLYDARDASLPESDESQPLRDSLHRVFARSAVVVCIIGEGARADAWIDWELRAARAAQPRPGLVGVLLEPWCVRPRAIVDAGAIFVPFKRDAVERAIRWAGEETRASGDFELVDD